MSLHMYSFSWLSVCRAKKIDLGEKRTVLVNPHELVNISSLHDITQRLLKSHCEAQCGGSSCFHLGSACLCWTPSKFKTGQRGGAWVEYRQLKQSVTTVNHTKSHISCPIFVFNFFQKVPTPQTWPKGQVQWMGLVEITPNRQLAVSWHSKQPHP